MLIINDNGNMDYVREKDDTDELCDEQKKAGLRNIATATSHR